MSTPDVRASSEFDPYDPAMTEPRVWDAYAGARRAGPAVRCRGRGGFWLVTGYDDVRSALRDPGTFSSASGHRVPTDGTRRSVPIDFDPPLHTAYRRLMAEALSPGRVRSLRPFLTEVVRDLVDGYVADGGGDFVQRVALPLPLQVLTEVVGFSGATVARFREVTEQLWARIADADYDVARRRIDDLMLAELAEHRAAAGRLRHLAARRPSRRPADP